VSGIRLVFLVSGALLGTFYPFLSVILQDRGFDPVGIGLVTAASSIAFAAAIPIWGHLADVTLGRSGALRLAALGSAAALVAFGAPLPAAVLAAIVIGYSLFVSAIGPLTDALAVNAMRDPQRQYGAIRMLSSASFAIVAIVCGALYDEAGYWPATLLFAAFGVALALSTGWAPDLARADLRSYGERRRGGSMRVAFRIQPRLPGVLLAILLVHIGILAGFTFLGLRLVELGGGPSDIALAAAVAAFAEVPAMLVAGRLARRIGLRTMFGLSTTAYAACLLFWSVADSPSLIIASRAVSGFAFASIWVSAVLTMGVLLPRRLQGTGQGLYQTTAFGFGALVGNGAGGFIYGSAGSDVLFALAALLGVLAAVVGWMAFPRRGESPDDLVAFDGEAAEPVLAST
jgi:MFS transporter, PPP family, 3-phenylpropionic acid transporter